jgi:antitoxin component YwqK of YwqJK toxin-antitoxin module
MMHYTSNVANYICVSNYTDGKLDGDYSETYEETGKTKVLGKYVRGNRHGVWEIYDFNGELKKTERYENGKLIEK